MKKLLLFAIMASFFSGCIKDTCKQTYTYTLYQPVYLSWTDFRKSVKSLPAHNIQKPGKIYYKFPYIFLNEENRGIHIIDNSNPTYPVNIAFINIPGNIDIGVKGNTLFADSYVDLVSIDISNPLAVSEIGRVENVFPARRYNYGFSDDPIKGVITGWITKDTTVTQDCNNPGIFFQSLNGGVALKSGSSFQPTIANSGSGSAVGIAGSLARFALVDNIMYTVSSTSLQVFDIATPNNISSKSIANIGFGIETIFPYNGHLFIGSTTGLFIYSISNPMMPVRKSQFAHVLSCDPVVANDSNAFVTLRSGTTCRAGQNQLDILDITNIYNPTLVKTMPMKNPRGLGWKNHILWICDGSEGLKCYDANDVTNLNLLSRQNGFIPNDVIPLINSVLVTADDGFYQFDYSNPAQPQLLSKINIVK